MKQAASENYRQAQEGATRSAREIETVAEYLRDMQGGEDAQTALNGLVSQLFVQSQQEWMRQNPDADLDEAMQRFADALKRYRTENTALSTALEGAGFAAGKNGDMNTALSYAADQLLALEERTGEEAGVQYLIKQNVEIDEQKIEENKIQVVQMESVKALTGGEFEKSDRSIIEQVGDFFREIGGNAYNEILGDVVLDENGVKDLLGHKLTRKKVIAFAAVKEVIENGEIIDAQKNWKGRKYDTYIIAAPITIVSEEYYMGTVVMRKDDNQRYRLHDLVAIKKSESDQPLKTRSNTYRAGDTPTINSILENLRENKEGQEKSLRKRCYCSAFP